MAWTQEGRTEVKEEPWELRREKGKEKPSCRKEKERAGRVCSREITHWVLYVKGFLKVSGEDFNKIFISWVSSQGGGLH